MHPEGPALEDGSMHERIQSMLASGAKTHFIFQDEEICLRHGYKVVADYVGSRFLTGFSPWEQLLSPRAEKWCPLSFRLLDARLYRVGGVGMRNLTGNFDP